MVDLTDLVCPVRCAPFFESLMTVFGYYGHSAVGAVIGATLLGHGYFYQSDRTKTAGLALLIVIVLASTIAKGLKFTQQPPTDMRPYLAPSGHMSAAFGLATVLSVGFPALSPVFWPGDSYRHLLYLLARTVPLERGRWRRYRSGSRSLIAITLISRGHAIR